MIDPEMDAMEERFHCTLADFYHNWNWKAFLNGYIQRTPNGFFYETANQRYRIEFSSWGNIVEYATGDDWSDNFDVNSPTEVYDRLNGWVCSLWLIENGYILREWKA